MIDLNHSISAGREWYWKAIKQGDNCPLCNRYGKLNPWYMYSTGVFHLALLAKLGPSRPNGWVHNDELKKHGFKGQGDITRLEFWGLAERSVKRKHGLKKGYSRYTEFGLGYLRGQRQIRHKCWVFGSKVIRFEGEFVDVREALQTRFDYDVFVKDIAPAQPWPRLVVDNTG